MTSGNGLAKFAMLKPTVFRLTLCCMSVGPSLSAQVEVFVPKQTITTATSIDLDGWLNGQLGNAAEGYSPQIPSGPSAFHFYMKIYRNSNTFDEQMQMFFQVTSAATSIQIDLDADHNHKVDGGNDRRIVVTRNMTTMSCSSCLEVLVVNADNSTTSFSKPVTQFNNGAGSVWTAEFALTTADLKLNFIPSLMGMHVQITPSLTLTAYPSGVMVGQMNQWAHVRSRNPIDFAIVLDNSGSMLSTDGIPPPLNSRWERAKRATDLFASALAVFADPQFSDKIGISQYSWICGDVSSGNRTADLPGFLTFVPIPNAAVLASTPLTAGIMTTPASNNCTPIHQGVYHALNEQGSAAATANPTRDRIVLLLSDGLHNMPTTFAWDFAPEQERLVQVRTVAIGPDGIVNTALLDQIATAFRGWWPAGGRYTDATKFAELLTAFIETLDDPFAINFVQVDGSGAYSPGPADKLVFIGVWNTAAMAQPLMIKRGTVLQTPSATYLSTKTGYAMSVFDNPAAIGGSWVMTGPTPTEGQRYVLADLRVFAQFVVEQRRYEAGEPIVLQASIRDQGSPVVGANVTVEVDGPGMGLGNYLSTIQQDCSFGRPRLQEQRSVDSMQANVQAHATAEPVRTDTAVGARDPLPGRYQLAATDFARCHLAGLRRDSLPGERLYDDGSHGDLAPDDGVYTLAFSATGLEGTRNFVFHMVGVTADGIGFARTRRLSRYVGVVPDPGATDQAIVLGGTMNSLQVAHIFFLPRDRLGNYLGPGFAQSFEVRSIGAQLVGAITDLENGYYRQTIRYPARGPEPAVTVLMPGTTFKDVIEFHPTPAIFKLLLRWACFIIVVILFALLLWRWRKAASTA